MTLIIIHVTNCHRVTSLAQCPLTIFLSFSPHVSTKKKLLMKYPANIVTKVYKPNWNSNRNLIIALLVCVKSTFEPTESTLLSLCGFILS